jgi:hypothetical protein
MAVSDQQRIGERYELRRTVGIGGMARVYLARDHVLNRDVAVKILNPALVADPTFVERFRREAQAAAALNHPNIVTIYDTGTTDDTYYIVMEYVPGQNLKEMVRAHGPLSEDDLLYIGAQIAAALDCAHRHDLIHRDIKPHNVLRAPDGAAKVTDFGIARAAGASQLTATQMVMGTAQYISPEQALHRPLDGRSDLYSLGVVLYELLVGHPPFTGDSPVAVAMQQVHDPPPPIRVARPEIAETTEAVVMRALTKDPAARFQTADAMRAALEEARTRLHTAQGTTTALPLPAPPPSPPDTRALVPERYVPDGPPPERRSRAPWLLLALVPLIAAVGIAGFLMARGRGGTTATATPRPATVAAAAQPATATPAPTATRPPAPAPTAAPAPTQAPTATALPPSPTALPATATPAPASPTPLAPPTTTAAPTQSPTATPAPPQPTPAPQAPLIANGSPQDAVRSFYALAAAHNYDAAAQLWSGRQKAAYPPGEYINGRFDATQRIDIRLGDVQVNQGEGRATVNVDIVETRSDGVRHYVGAWQCVRTQNGWLLDYPNLSQV